MKTKEDNETQVKPEGAPASKATKPEGAPAGIQLELFLNNYYSESAIEAIMYKFTRITKNAARCKLCNDIIESTYTHDYVSCSCGEISVDGGKSYCRCSAKNFENFESLSESRQWTVEETEERLNYLQKQLDAPYTGEYSKGMYREEQKELALYLELIKEKGNGNDTD